MTEIIRYLTHPQVHIDPDLPVPAWSLNTIGQYRARQLVRAGWLAKTTQIISSAEKKAIETAEPIAAALGLEIEIRDAMHENDRSSTGYLAAEEFERVASSFFSNPMTSIRGWERAIDAQARIVGEVQSVLARKTRGDVLFIGHGGVGTLLLCKILGATISRAFDQPPGGGNYFSFAKEGWRLLHDWRQLEYGASGAETNTAA